MPSAMNYKQDNKNISLKKIVSLPPGSPEKLFSLRVIRHFIKKDNSSLPIPENILWKKLNPWIVTCNMQSIFHSVLSKVELPKDINEQWRAFSINIWHKHEQFSSATTKLFSIFKQHNIDAIVLRGLSISTWLYDNPTLRPMGDVDILIRKDDRLLLLEAFKQNGYIPHKILRSQIVYKIDNTLFEIHWSFFTPKRYQNHRHLFDEWFLSTKHITKGQGFFNILSPEYQCLDLITHGFVHHGFDRPLQLIDLGLLMTNKSLNWHIIKNWCKKASMSSITGFSLWYVNRLFELGMDEKIAPFFDKSFNCNDKVYYAYQDLIFGPDPLSSYLLRKKHLLQVTEDLSTCLKQGVSFLNVKELLTLKKALANRGYLIRKSP
ncbi:hypothetical protein MTBBW1_50058 [Desulfamplus magnetovallimortis]|uniref:Nucleotidyltransferase family protein n=1 Tax=Desulfamplus magnetovallimortis TaxID=1246637 RepID=A0A1W1HHN3_9BACT|nr:nucleotidyltransferase family protein [Desulfamplus magnetovallimortis]SLM31935.1 hypothetical protein MTBBW1_50058 [Desulfamplus magnetovallimortis]